MKRVGVEVLIKHNNKVHWNSAHATVAYNRDPKTNSVNHPTKHDP
jgi:hypothetical protein